MVKIIQRLRMIRFIEIYPRLSVIFAIFWCIFVGKQVGTPKYLIIEPFSIWLILGFALLELITYSIIHLILKNALKLTGDKE
jgi:hypothetical protein